MIATVSIKDSEYTDGQKTLISLWDNHAKQVDKGTPDMGIIFTLPRYKRGERKRFEGFKVTHHTVTSQGRDLVRMSTEDFLLLMAKSGVKVDIEELPKATDSTATAQ